MLDFDDLKVRLTENQRLLLTEIWTHYLATGQWILRRRLHYMFRSLGREGVESALQNPLGGAVVYRATENGLDKYRLTILGVLLSDRGEEAEHLLARYLDYVRGEFQRDPDITQIKSEDAEAALSMTKQESRLLWELINLGGSWSGSAGGNKDDWSAGLPRDVEDLLAVRDLEAHIHERAMDDDDPEVPIDEAGRQGMFPWRREARVNGEVDFTIESSEEGEQSSGYDQGTLHLEIDRKCFDLFTKRAYGEAVEMGFKVVRDRLRDLTGYETGSEAFGKGKLHVKGAAASHVDRDFNEGVKFLTMAIDDKRGTCPRSQGRAAGERDARRVPSDRGQQCPSSHDVPRQGAQGRF
jgi:hypothetical protein